MIELIQQNEYILIAIWGFLGSLVGYIALGMNPELTPKTRVKICIKHIIIGLFTAVCGYILLVEFHSFGKQTNLALAGILAVLIPNFMLERAKSVRDSIIEMLVNKYLGRGRPHGR